MTDKVRDHLANERTFLSWVRTSLGLIGLGFVMTRMGLFLRELASTVPATRPMAGLGLTTHHEFLLAGVVFLVIGTAMTGWSGWVYRRNLRAIEREEFEPARGMVVALTAIVLLGGFAIVVLVVWKLVAEA